MSERRSNTICAAVERTGRHCGDDRVCYSDQFYLPLDVLVTPYSGLIKTSSRSERNQTSYPDRTGGQTDGNAFGTRQITQQW